MTTCFKGVLSCLRRSLLLVAAYFFLAGPALTQEIPHPSAPVVLTVKGKIKRTNFPGEARFDLNMLTAIGRHDISTTTPWTKGMQKFEGVLARDLLSYLGAKGTSVVARALNDYTSTIPIRDFFDYDVLLATRRDGKRLRVRDMGPIFIVYPFSDHPKLLNEKVLSRSVWQLTELSVE